MRWDETTAAGNGTEPAMSDGNGVGRIRTIVADHGRLPVDVATLADDDDLYAAGLTSHASVNVMLAIEEAFGIEFPREALQRSTFQSITAMHRTVEGIVGLGTDVA